VQNSHCVQILRSSILTLLLHTIQAVGFRHTLQRSGEGAIYIWQGGHHVRHQPTF